MSDETSLTPDDPSAPQREASDPNVSAWVTANAGSGKTKVLVDRVARLLLGTGEGEPDPSRILCLTFTKAAAATMQNKLFAQLGDWALMSDDDLLDALQELHGPEHAALIGEKELPRARRLFAQALETPGGLRIQTIHAFCESLLRRFPWEAGVSPDFALIEDLDAEALTIEARDAVFDAAFEAGDGAPLQQAVKRVINDEQEGGLGAFIKEILEKRDLFDMEETAFVEASAAGMGIAADLDMRALEQDFQALLAHPDVRAVAKVSQIATEAVQKKGAILLSALETDDPVAIEASLRSFLFTDKKTIRANILTGDAKKQHPDVLNAALGLAGRIAVIDAQLQAGQALERVKALHVFAQRLTLEHDRTKRAANALDFDDLIEKAAELLSQNDARAWVRFKLDGGVDHILVDEAQDTSPRQWEIITAIAEEFYAGDSARSLDRTVFVVGDEKQSIFSFQGAQPEELNTVRMAMEARILGADKEFKKPELRHSFRSAPAILKSVDAIFADPAAHEGLSTLGEAPKHIAFREEAPGRVDFWPLLSPDEEPEKPPWYAPVDTQPANAPHIRLATAIADQIKGWLDSGEHLPARDRPIKPGDIMILVRRRHAIVDELIRNLKRRHVPVAGRDRLILTDEIIVQDLLALARFVLLPQDDLTLATVLRSPLFGITESELEDLAVNREGSLWQALNQRAVEDMNFARIKTQLSELMDDADFLPPFEFFQRALIEQGGRQRLLDRLGNEAAETLDTFLEAALNGSIEITRNLQSFVQAMERSKVEMKREMEQGRDEVRIMTVHGAKGLEAPIVIMPDICSSPPPIKQKIFPFENGGAVWAPNKDALPGACAAIKEDIKTRQEKEERRLLYVGLTRAEDWLIVGGWHGKKKPTATSWTALMQGYRDTLQASCPTPLRDENQQPIAGIRFENHGKAKKEKRAGETILTPLPLPDAMMRPKSESSAQQPLAPSRLAEKEPFVPNYAGDENAEGALSSAERGIEVHRLLEILAESPPEERAALAASFAEESEIADISLAVKIIEDPDFKWMFGEGSKAEVTLIGPLDCLGGRAINGYIDRLVIRDEGIDIIDFKTGHHAQGAPIPESYLRQLAIYREAVREMGLGKDVRAHLLWVDMMRHEAVPENDLDDALKRIIRDHHRAH